MIKEPIKEEENENKTVKKKDKTAKDKGSIKNKKRDPEKFSHELTEAEQISLVNFKKKKGKKGKS